MRLWSLHPKHLDKAGLGALWREGLLARAVLTGQTRGYRNHPQLDRFKGQARPVEALDSYLHCVVDEADRRGYNYNRTKLGTRRSAPASMLVRSGQVQYESDWLNSKLMLRTGIGLAGPVQPHPDFTVVPGGVESWEKVKK